MAANQSGSRAGLITALVIFVVLFFVAAILASVKWADYNREVQARGEMEEQYADIMSRTDLSRARTLVTTLREQDGGSRRSALDILTSQRNQLAAQLAGREMTTENAIQTWQAIVNGANESLKSANVTVTVPSSSPGDAVNTLVQAIAQRQRQVADMEGQVAELQKQLQQAVAAHAAARKQLEDALHSAQGATSTERARIDKILRDNQATLADLEQREKAAIENARRISEELTTQLHASAQQIKELTEKNDRAAKRLRMFLPGNISEFIRRPDGKIIQVSRNDVVYINLGAGQQITAGMTFEVYDKHTGIPKAATAAEEDQLPVGKASLEVVSVGAGSSECRLIRVSPGQQVVEGDLIANLIYDVNVKYAFKVYGKFDIDQNGLATLGEAETVRRLITQWGGKLTEEINTDTDFVVLGKEPVLPELEPGDPISQLEYDNAVEELDRYLDVRNKALDLHIPVLNQNRFLYLVGFFDQARR